MNLSSLKIHLPAALFFAGLSLFAFYQSEITADGRWRFFAALSLGSAVLAWHRSRRDRSPKSDDERQIKQIENGRLPNRHNPRVELKDFENCHFSIPASLLFFAPLPEDIKIEPTRMVIRQSGGAYYYIVRQQVTLLRAEPDDQTHGELVITSRRIIFLAEENGFEVPLQSVKMLDCSAHLVDFLVRDRRYTIQTDAAVYAEKVLQILMTSTM